MDGDRHLHIYLNDHLAGSTFGTRLAERCMDRNQESPLGAYLQVLAREIEEDRETLKEIMQRLGIGFDQWKVAAAAVAERLARFKPSGSLLGYSDLARVEEIEALSLGIEGKLLLWRVLGHLAPTDDRLSSFDFEALVGRARGQRRKLETFRLGAAATSFA